MILGVILRVGKLLEMVWDAQWNHYLGLGHHSGDPRGDPRGDSKGGIGDSYDRNDSER